MDRAAMAILVSSATRPDSKGASAAMKAQAKSVNEGFGPCFVFPAGTSSQQLLDCRRLA
jgi:hypothetical protein